MNLAPSRSSSPKTVSRNQPPKSRPDGEITASLKRTRLGVRWVRILHSLDQKWRKSEKNYRDLAFPIDSDLLENLPSPFPVSESLLNFWEREGRKEERTRRLCLWEKVKKRICPQLTTTEKKIFLRILHAPKIQNWEIASTLGLSTGTIRWYRRRIERKLKSEFHQPRIKE